LTRDRRTGLDVLSYDECLSLLARAPIGRVAVHLNGHPPVIFPINYTLHDTNIVFRTDTSCGCRKLVRACWAGVSRDLIGSVVLRPSAPSWLKPRRRGGR
jgi:Pyridoxamine 5'-phosphate oxidase